MLRPRWELKTLRSVVMAVDEIVDHMSGTAQAHVRQDIRDMRLYRWPNSYGEPMPNNASIEYFPGPVMTNSKKPPIMLRSL
jgi:hypothetical protein